MAKQAPPTTTPIGSLIGLGINHEPTTQSRLSSVMLKRATGFVSNTFDWIRTLKSSSLETSSTITTNAYNTGDPMTTTTLPPIGSAWYRTLYPDRIFIVLAHVPRT